MQLESLNPANGELVGTVEITPVEAIPAIVATARSHQAQWAARSLEERAAILTTAAAELRDASGPIAELATDEMGKPLVEARGEVEYAVTSLVDDLPEMIAALSPEIRENETVRSTIYHDPFGVAACISPWNFPVLMPHEQVVPALIAGNVVILKPSEETPLVGQAYADALNRALPAGVLQVVHGGGEQGRALVAADVDLIVFTGSRAAGKHILAQASQHMKRVVLELGGKDPLIVLADADISAAAKFAARNSFRNAGQVCVSTERIYVDERIHDEFVDALRKAASKLTVANGRDHGARIGPMVNLRQKEHVQAQVASALHAGARQVWQGSAPDRGNFLAPSILTEVRDDMDIASEETFGPVACVMRFSDEDDAVKRANDTPFGLGAVVFGAPEHAAGVGRRLGAGMIGINQGLSSAGSTPWVGARESGYGFHSGPDGHRQFAQVRVVSEAKQP
ncbi:MAG: aldehyde dehydrogenase family protein [Gammaproteobacteria bacterium]|jgi:succinate-semialdehyde dehydrogenase/glutarate-semialdehyde dehydrogenase|nr:aldehyde dehydrogenase family protein [Gammaproteobacteria bacterium]